MHDSAWSPDGESRGVAGVNGPQHLLRHVRQDIPSMAWLEALYASFGFEHCSPFADYIADPNSVFMTKEL